MFKHIVKFVVAVSALVSIGTFACLHPNYFFAAAMSFIAVIMIAFVVALVWDITR